MWHGERDVLLLANPLLGGLEAIAAAGPGLYGVHRRYSAR